MPRARTQQVYPESVIPNGGLFGGERNHRGLDHSRTRALQHNESTTFRPWAEGEIVTIRKEDKGVYGRYIEIVDDEGVYWSYCHAAEITDGLHTGDRVVFTTRLGVMGSSGTAVAAGSEHLHTMCSKHKGSAVELTTEVFDPLAHITARLVAPSIQKAELLAPEPEERDPDMFQYRKQSGTRWFVHPNLKVRRIKPDEWSANDELGIRTVRKVDNSKAEVFRRAQNARARQLDPADAAEDAETPVEEILDRLDLPDDIAGTVSDAVYARVDAEPGPLDNELLEQITNEAVIAAGGELKP